MRRGDESFSARSSGATFSAGGLPVTADELIAEGQRLARPCVHLRPEGDKSAFAAVWGGAGRVAPPPPSDDLNHWLSFGCQFLPVGVGPKTGVASLYTEDGDR